MVPRPVGRRGDPLLLLAPHLQAELLPHAVDRAADVPVVLGEGLHHLGLGLLRQLDARLLESLQHLWWRHRRP